MRRLISTGAILAVLGWPSLTLNAQESQPDLVPKTERHAAHLIDAVRAGDPSLHEALEGAAMAVRAGHEAVILFDAKSVTSLRINRQKKIPLEEAEIPGSDRAALADLLGLPPTEAPHNYFEVIDRLAKAGAKVFINRGSVRLYGLQEEEIRAIGTLISSRKMADMLENSDVCYTYSPMNPRRDR